jgi:hypothetical protein
MEKYKFTSSELIKKVNEVANEVLNGNTNPWVIFPSIKLTKEDFIKYRKAKNV